MANKKALRFWAILLTAMQLPVGAYAADADWHMESSGEIKRANESVNTNPWNVASIAGGGESGTAEIVTVYGGVKVKLDAPLYKLSEGYSDRIVEKDGLWGVERNVTVIAFDGSENWEIYKQPGYQNSNTIIFTCTAPEDYRIQNGVSTHFDVVLDSAQKNRIYDGISFGRQRDTILMRFMKVRGIDSVDGLKSYLKGQYDAGRAVKLLYPAVESTFTPFDEDTQKQLKGSEVLGFRDSGPLRFGQDEIKLAEIFEKETSENYEMDHFLCGIDDVRIFNSDENKKYFIEGVYPGKEGVTVKAADTAGGSFSGTLRYNEQDFLASRLTELVLGGDGGTEIRLRLNLSKVKVPSEAVNGFGYEDTALTADCIKAEHLVLPDYMPMTDNRKTPFYTENSLIYDNETKPETVGKIDENRAYLTVKADDMEKSMEIITPTEKRERLNILFLGDSLINQNYYTAEVKKLFEDDSIKLSFIGTLGTDGARHEGRGGWSAYDYCRMESKYGYSNPFLNEGKFDFEHYMDKNNYDKADIVVLNLGINDLNLLEHNGHEEILGYFSEITESIHEYDPSAMILINLPILPYNSVENEAYRYDRLELAESLYKEFGNREADGVILVPLYLSVDPEMSYKLCDPVIDEFNQDYGLIVTDATHPSIRGYTQMAEMTYNYIKFAAAIVR